MQCPLGCVQVHDAVLQTIHIFTYHINVCILIYTLLNISIIYTIVFPAIKDLMNVFRVYKELSNISRLATTW